MSKIPAPPAPKKEVIAPHHESLAVEPADDPADLERNYGDAWLWLAARDPRCLFAYWEFRAEEHPAAFDGKGSAQFFLRIFRDGGMAENATGIEPGPGHAFILAPSPDSAYFAELGFFAGEIWCFIARSDLARTPPEQPRAEAAPAFVTIPARLSLPEMPGLLAANTLPGESPAMTAARIQQGARDDGEWTPGHARLLAEILGVSASAPAPMANFPTLAVREKLALTAAAATSGARISSAPSDDRRTSPEVRGPSASSSFYRS